MKNDLPKYFRKNNVTFNGVSDIIEFNKKDSLKRAPYGQGIFKSINLDSTQFDEISIIKSRIKKEGKNILIQQLKHIN
jgi:amidase